MSSSNLSFKWQRGTWEGEGLGRRHRERFSEKLSHWAGSREASRARMRSRQFLCRGKLVCALGCDIHCIPHPTLHFQPSPAAGSSQPHSSHARHRGGRIHVFIAGRQGLRENGTQTPHGTGLPHAGDRGGSQQARPGGVPSTRDAWAVGQQPAWAPASPVTQPGSPQDGQGWPGEAWGGPEIVLSGCVPEKGL